jgi:hypothetical protein
MTKEQTGRKNKFKYAQRWHNNEQIIRSVDIYNQGIADCPDKNKGNTA